MKKVNITLAFDEDKLDALEFSLKKENSSVQSRMEDALRQLYEKTVLDRCGNIWTAGLHPLPSPSARPRLRSRRQLLPR